MPLWQRNAIPRCWSVTLSLISHKPVSIPSASMSGHPATVLFDFERSLMVLSPSEPSLNVCSIWGQKTVVKRIKIAPECQGRNAKEVSWKSFELLWRKLDLGSDFEAMSLSNCPRLKQFVWIKWIQNTMPVYGDVCQSVALSQSRDIPNHDNCMETLSTVLRSVSGFFCVLNRCIWTPGSIPMPQLYL